MIHVWRGLSMNNIRSSNTAENRAHCVMEDLAPFPPLSRDLMSKCSGIDVALCSDNDTHSGTTTHEMLIHLHTVNIWGWKWDEKCSVPEILSAAALMHWIRATNQWKMMMIIDTQAHAMHKSLLAGSPPISLSYLREAYGQASVARTRKQRRYLFWLYMNNW